MRNSILSTPSKTTDQQAAPTGHSPWCQPTHCLTFPGLDATHRNLIGQVAGVEVWVERPDTTRSDGTHEHGVPGVHVFSQGTLPLTAAERHELTVLVDRAGLFADDNAAVR